MCDSKDIWLNYKDTGILVLLRFSWVLWPKYVCAPHYGMLPRQYILNSKVSFFQSWLQANHSFPICVEYLLTVSGLCMYSSSKLFLLSSFLPAFSPHFIFMSFLLYFLSFFPPISIPFPLSVLFLSNLLSTIFKQAFLVFLILHSRAIRALNPHVPLQRSAMKPKR